MLFLLLLVLLGVAWYVTSVPEVGVPDCNGLAVEEAVQVLAVHRLGAPVVEERYDRDVPPGVVFGQDPLPGRRVKQGRSVYLQVSRGGRELAMPELVGHSIYDAKEIVARKRLTMGTVHHRTHERYTEKRVLQQDPLPGMPVTEGETVTLWVSNPVNVLKVRVPTVIGLSYDEATRVLRDRAFEVTLYRGHDAEGGGVPAPTARVFKQSPLPGVLVENTETVVLYVETSP